MCKFRSRSWSVSGEEEFSLPIWFQICIFLQTFFLPELAKRILANYIRLEIRPLFRCPPFDRGRRIKFHAFYPACLALCLSPRMCAVTKYELVTRIQKRVSKKATEIYFQSQSFAEAMHFLDRWRKTIGEDGEEEDISYNSMCVYLCTSAILLLL